MITPKGFRGNGLGPDPTAWFLDVIRYADARSFTPEDSEKWYTSLTEATGLDWTRLHKEFATCWSVPSKVLAAKEAMLTRCSERELERKAEEEEERRLEEERRIEAGILEEKKWLAFEIRREAWCDEVLEILEVRDKVLEEGYGRYQQEIEIDEAIIAEHERKDLEYQEDERRSEEKWAVMMKTLEKEGRRAMEGLRKEKEELAEEMVREQGVEAKRQQLDAIMHYASTYHADPSLHTLVPASNAFASLISPPEYQSDAEGSMNKFERVEAEAVIEDAFKLTVRVPPDKGGYRACGSDRPRGEDPGRRRVEEREEEISKKGGSDMEHTEIITIVLAKHVPDHDGVVPLTKHPNPHPTVMMTSLSRPATVVNLPRIVIVNVDPPPTILKASVTTIPPVIDGGIPLTKHPNPRSMSPTASSNIQPGSIDAPSRIFEPPAILVPLKMHVSNGVIEGQRPNAGSGGAIVDDIEQQSSTKRDVLATKHPSLCPTIVMDLPSILAININSTSTIFEAPVIIVPPDIVIADDMERDVQFVNLDPPSTILGTPAAILPASHAVADDTKREYSLSKAVPPTKHPSPRTTTPTTPAITQPGDIDLLSTRMLLTTQILPRNVYMDTNDSCTGIERGDTTIQTGDNDLRHRRMSTPAERVERDATTTICEAGGHRFPPPGLPHPPGHFVPTIATNPSATTALSNLGHAKCNTTPTYLAGIRINPTGTVTVTLNNDYGPPSGLASDTATLECVVHYLTSSHHSHEEHHTACT
ncbi:hypothetical protein BOTBODRAFT_180907 [Botryobasidium botryosum FD-172 SS1]|uniref:Uncharacterized protein n=1 Tax=Botryobasidium botryosum (strain FD-172 SS1) TaxID=930990 RepID=A0A067LXS7_BOTB1|nr:hypothetical protein BOTBODRAFT_180907 [Botryobasidium botryosum FD-172 SS1]